MKRFTIFLFMISGIFFSRVNAQSVLEVPPLTDGQPTALNAFIQNDSTAPADRVYKLERGKKYLFNQTCEINRSLRITSDSLPLDVPPATVVAGPDPETAELPDRWFYLTGSNIDLHISNIMISGVAPSQEYVGAWLFTLVGDSLDILYTNTIINGFGGGVTNVDKKGQQKISFRAINCIFRNIQYQNHPFMGQSNKVKGAHQQLYLVKNCTFFNCNSYEVLLIRPCDSILIEHNTFFGNTIQPFYNFYAVNETVRDNVFFAQFSFGVPKDALDGGWFKDSIPGIISLHKLDPSFGIDEKDRKVVITNNAYFVPKAIDDYWQTAIDNGWDSICVLKPQFIVPETQAMFDDDENYPYLLAENNYMDVDPGFRQGLVDTIVEQRLDFNNKFAQYSWDMPAERPYHYAPNGDIFNIPWPLPENLRYTNDTLMTAATDGGPLGDPRWFASPAGIFSPKNSETIGLTVFPNPVVSNATVSFTLDTKGRTTLKIYNVAGQLVKSIFDKDYLPGKYEVQFNTGDLPDGLYFIKLRANGKVATRKMIINN